MVGLTGVGKSTTCNNILASVYLSKETPRYGRNKKWGTIPSPFETSARGESVTAECKKKKAQVHGHLIDIVDTPGFYDTKRSSESSTQEILKCMYLTAPGPHAIILLVSIGRQTNDVIKGVNMLKKIFGDGCLKFVMVVFTGADKLKMSDETIDDLVEEMDGPIKELLEECENRYVAFDNTVKPISGENIDQVNQVLTMAEEVAKNNEGRYFSDDLFKRVADILDKKVKGSAMQIKELKIMKNELEKKLKEARRNLKESEESKNTTEAEKAELRKEIENLNRKIEAQNEQIRDLQQAKENEAEEDEAEVLKGKC